MSEGHDAAATSANFAEGSQGPLAGLRILDLSRVLAGPFCTQLLADFGADVIKVEQPGRGDDSRFWGPPFVATAGGQASSESAYYLATNRNKQSITIDLSHPGGQDLLRTLMTQCDVLIENFKVGTMEKYNLSYNKLSTIHKKLVYCSISGFGQDGPYAKRAGYDFLIQAMGGLMSITGPVTAEPSKTGVAIVDIMCGMYAATAIQAAIHHRDLTGQGQYIDLALLDTQLAWLANVGSSYLLSGQQPARFGNGHPSIVPYDIFPVADGYIALAVGNDRQFQRLCSGICAEELANDCRFISNSLRVANRRELHLRLSELLLCRAAADWIERLNGLGVPCGPVNTVAEAFADPQVQHRQMVVSMPHPDAANGQVKMIANPVKFSETPVRYRYAPPKLGQDTDAVLQTVLGFDAARIQALRAEGIV